MEKKKYYVSIASGEISQVKYGNNADFVIFATRQEVDDLRRTLTHMDAADAAAYWRAHIPFKPYHDDVANDDYDEYMTIAMEKIYKLGDDATKEHIEESGILSDRPIQTSD